MTFSTIIVGFGVSSSGNEAFRWTSDGGMVGLGDLPGAISKALLTICQMTGMWLLVTVMVSLVTVTLETWLLFGTKSTA